MDDLQEVDEVALNKNESQIQTTNEETKETKVIPSTTIKSKQLLFGID